MTESIPELINKALEEKVFPGGVLIASQNGEVAVSEAFGRTDYASGQPVSVNTVYDLASLTKPLATTLAIICLVKSAKLSLHRPLGECLPQSRGE